jgi:hypothetical protein
MTVGLNPHAFANNAATALNTWSVGEFGGPVSMRGVDVYLGRPTSSLFDVTDADLSRQVAPGEDRVPVTAHYGATSTR